MDLEHHQLDLRYEHLRLRCPERERRLLASLAEHGQQIPIVVVAAAAETDQFIVVDGYKRVRAMRRLAQDTLQAACWDLSELEALLLGRQMRTGAEESAFEQGLWLQELHRRFAVSLEDLARRFDRSVSWVSRRLALVRDLPEGVRQRVVRGDLVAHAAMKSLVPLARVNPQECERLVEAIAGRGFTTRQVGELVAAYRSGGARTRALVLADPLLVLRAREEGRRPAGTEPLGPAAELQREFEVLASVARRALKRLCEGGAVALSPAEWDELAEGFCHAERAVGRLARQIHKEIDDARSAATPGDPPASPPGPGAPCDRENNGDRPRHGAQGDPLGDGRCPAAAAGRESRASPREDPRAARHVQGEPRACP